jgi:hypothetical protein
MPGKVDGDGSSGPSQVLECPPPEDIVSPGAVNEDHVAGSLSCKEVEHCANATYMNPTELKYVPVNGR